MAFEVKEIFVIAMHERIFVDACRGIYRGTQRHSTSGTEHDLGERGFSLARVLVIGIVLPKKTDALRRTDN